HAAVFLNARQVPATFTGTVFNQLGKGQHQGVAGVEQVAVAGAQAAFQLQVHGQKMAIEHVGAVLGFLEAQGCLDAGLKLHDAERLGNEIVGAIEEELGHDVGVGPTRRHDQLQVRAGRRLAELLTYLRARNVRHVDVEQYQVIALFFQHRQRLLAAFGFVAVQSFRLEHEAAEAANAGLIVDDENIVNAAANQL